MTGSQRNMLSGGRFACLFLIALIQVAAPGTFSDSLFRVFSLSTNLINQDSLQLSARNSILAKIETVARPSNTNNRMQAPDCAGWGNGRFTFFWADSLRGIRLQPVYDTIYRRDFQITPVGVDTGTPKAIMSYTVRSPAKYLHADRGLGGDMVSFINKSSPFDSLLLFNDLALARTKIGMATRATQCCWKKDTFLVLYQSDDMIIKMRRAARAANAITLLGIEGVVAVNPSSPPDAHFDVSNPAIAADNIGNVLVVWAVGSGNPGYPKSLRCRTYDASLVKGDSLDMNTPVDSFTLYNSYDDAPVAAYADNRFGVVSWSPSGIQFRSITVGGGPLSAVSEAIEPGPNVRYPCIASNGRYVTVVWMRENTGLGQVRIEGVRDTVYAGYVPFSSAVNQIRFSDVWLPSSKTPGNKLYTSSFQFALNCAMDSVGSVAATWPLDSLVNARMWASRSVRADSGVWVSKSTRYMDNSLDSAYLLPGSFTVGDITFHPPNTDSSKILVHVGLDSADESAWRGWVPVTADSATLAAATMGPYRFFKYKIVLYRGQDTLGTPLVRKCQLRWNAKPSFAALDSVYVNATKSPGMNFGITDTVLSRSDTLAMHFTLRDADASDTLYSRVFGYPAIIDSLDTLYPATGRSTAIKCLPCGRSDSTIGLTFSASDKKAWNATPTTFFIRTRNSVPQLHAFVLLDTNHTGIIDTQEIVTARTFNLQETDSMSFLYACKDTNDNTPQFKAYCALDRVKTDSAQQGTNKTYKFKASSGRAAGDTLVFSFADPETTVTRTVYFRVNHFPAVSSLVSAGRLIHKGDTISVGVGALISMTVNARDTDVTFWDHLTYRYTMASKDTSTTASSFTFAASRSDSSMLVRVTDSFGKTDSLRFFMKSPWLATDTSANKPFQAAKKLLQDSMSLIIGSGAKDSVQIPLVNTGNDTLRFMSLSFKGAASAWIQVRVPNQAAGGLFDSLANGKIDTVAVAPGSTKTVTVYIDASKLSGDGIMRDTIVIATNDFSHQYDTIPVALEYNDLPRIFSITLDFPKDKPYWLAKKAAAAKAAQYNFPPHAKIAVKFSEPMDTASAGAALSAYSVFEKRMSNPPPPIALDRAWTAGDSVLTLTPRYTAPSLYYNNFLPPPGFFIPGDSIVVKISTAITDMAKTPHGPNGLDVHKTAVRTANADTAIPLRVDSITYTIDSVYPKDNDTGISAGTQLSLTFSGPPLPTTVDTAKTNNRCLIVRSKYFNNAPVVFSSIVVSGSTVTFRLAKQFFYGDTVTCYYRARWARDSMGYPVDLNKNGIPMSMFDTTSTEDDKQWSFIVKDMVHTGVSPLKNASDVSPATAISVKFTDSIPAASVDTARRGNQQLIVSTAFSKGKQIAFDSVRTQRNSVVYYPARRFFYGDTVFCAYQGLMTKDSLRYSIDLTGKQVLSTGDKTQWHFAVKSISVISSKPDSASHASIHPTIVLGFSDRVYAGTFDTDTSVKNRSFTLSSTYFDSTLSFKSISFSSDSTQITIKPKTVFFSNDSIHCFFKGFSKAFRYDTTVNLPSDTAATIASHDWYFYTENTGFYTYPNPYKPGSDPRHCRNAATDPCGIWFTNLHLLRKDVSDVVIKIFGMNANPLYNTQTAGIGIHFSVSDPGKKPQWKWDTKNQRGEFVASGLYFYAITDLKGSVLTKGKIMIVR